MHHRLTIIPDAPPIHRVADPQPSISQRPTRCRPPTFFFYYYYQPVFRFQTQLPYTTPITTKYNFTKGLGLRTQRIADNWIIEMSDGVDLKKRWIMCERDGAQSREWGLKRSQDRERCRLKAFLRRSKEDGRVYQFLHLSLMQFLFTALLHVAYSQPSSFGWLARFSHL